MLLKGQQMTNEEIKFFLNDIKTRYACSMSNTQKGMDETHATWINDHAGWVRAKDQRKYAMKVLSTMTKRELQESEVTAIEKSINWMVANPPVRVAR